MSAKNNAATLAEWKKNDENIREISEYLREQLTAEITEKVQQIAEQKAAETGLPAGAFDVLVSQILMGQIELLRDKLAGQAEVDGVPVSLVGAAAGVSNATNTRRSLPFMRQFRDSQIAANLTGQTVWVTSGVNRLPVTPDD